MRKVAAFKKEREIPQREGHGDGGGGRREAT
jgi:hypothetical protein